VLEHKKHIKRSTLSSSSSEPEKKINKRRLVKKSSVPVAYELDHDGDEKAKRVCAFDEAIKKRQEETAELAGQEDKVKEVDANVGKEDRREGCVVKERNRREEPVSHDDVEVPIIRSMSPEF
jgi:hypothetical protein